jgi:hypothetical protein
MNRTSRKRPQRHDYESYEQLRGHLNDFVSACSFARLFKILKGLSPTVHLHSWTKELGGSSSIRSSKCRD